MNKLPIFGKQYYENLKGAYILKGCQRKIVYLKNTKSAYFDEAYFIMKPSAEGTSEESVLREAERILGHAELPKAKRHTIGGMWLFFVYGLLSGAILAFTISLFLF